MKGRVPALFRIVDILSSHKTVIPDSIIGLGWSFGVDGPGDTLVLPSRISAIALHGIPIASNNRVSADGLVSDPLTAFGSQTYLRSIQIVSNAFVVSSELFWLLELKPVIGVHEIILFTFFSKFFKIVNRSQTRWSQWKYHHSASHSLKFLRKKDH